MNWKTLPLLIFSILTIAASPAAANPITKDNFDIGWFTANNASYYSAESNLKEYCERERINSRKRYNREIRKAKYKLDRKDKTREKRAKKTYKKEQKLIDQYCEDSFKKLKKAYRQKAKKKQKRFILGRHQSSTNLSEALRLHEYECGREEREAKEWFFREKRKIGKSLSALDRDQYERQAQLNKLRKRYERERTKIRRECKKEEQRITKYYLDLGVQKARRIKRSEMREMIRRKKEEKPRMKRVRKKKEKLIEDIRVSGRIDQEVAYRTVTPKQLSKNISRLRLNQYVSFSDALSLRLSERIEYDSVFELTENYPDNVKDDQEFEAEIRDAFFDVSTGYVDFRVGHQQIVWGETIGLFIADIVNGQDLREYILKDFDLIRLHQWSAEMSMSFGSVSSELIVTIPRFNKLAEPGGEFEFASPIPAGVPVHVIKENPPESNVNNAEYGGRIGYLAGGLDLGFLAFIGWDKNPFFKKSLNTLGQLEFKRKYKRKNSLGMVFSKDVSDSIVKGEFVLTPQKTFQDADPFDDDGLTKKPLLDYAVGIDPSFLGDIESNFQFIQRIIPDAPSTLINEEEVRTLMSAWIKDSWFNGHINPEVLVMTGVGYFDLLVRPKLGITFNNFVKMDVGVDVFDGKDDEGLYGIFKDNDRVFANLGIHF